LSTIYPGITLSGNFIEKIVHIKDGPSWVLTNHGLDRIDMKAGNAATFPQFNGREQLCVNNTGDMFAVTADKRLLCFRNNASGFESVATLPGQTGNVKSLWCNNGKLYVVSGSGLTSFTINTSDQDGTYTLGDIAELTDIEVNYAKPDGNGFIVLTADGQLCKLSLEGSVKNLTDLSAEVKKRGRVSDIAIDRRGNIFISFLTAGVIRVKPSFPGNYSIDDIGLKAGVFCLDSSDRQNVVWIGSDCHGLYTLGEYEYSITSVNFPVLDKMISHPVRALYLDSDSTLWVGTKGSGLLRIHHFDERDNSLKFPRKELLLSENSNLIHNSVFALSKSSRPVLWIATEEGINYYDYRDKRLKRIAPHPLLRFVQDIREENDSTLLLATLGLGLVKAHITDLGNELQLTDIRNYVTDNGNFSSNYFFSMSPHKKHGLLLGNRGLGVFR
ncbi:MAG: hypothetical protein K2L78_07005, partial [Muribaculaceae bacterium]|nr:hypothetical protein [Muribaculaceae bacterium]